MSEFNIEDLDAVIAEAGSSLVQMLALQLRSELENSANLREQLSEAQREFRSADITMQNLEAQLKQSKIDADCYKKGMEASNARLVQIAAELSAIDAIHNDAVFITDAHYEQCPPEAQKIIGTLAALQIPAYKSFLAEVRAQGVDMFAHDVGESEQGNGLMKAIGRRATKFADQLRKGVQS
ncbi:hypothetical protein NPF39_001006 [Salmonella enterica subsp. enterica serovar Uganda]|nr:hypothetical protein [Salmonella enterica subsp. enterica serovar Uganda]